MAEVTGRMLSLLPRQRAFALTEVAVIIDLDTTDVEVYGRKKRGVVLNTQRDTWHIGGDPATVLDLVAGGRRRRRQGADRYHSPGL